MPNPDSLRSEANRLRQEAESKERHAQDIEQHLRAQQQTIQNMERTRQDWQNRLHQLEMQLAATADLSQSRAINSQIQDATRKLMDQDRQIQTARNEYDKLLH